MLIPFFGDLSIDDLVTAKENTEQHFNQFKTVGTRVKKLANDISKNELTVYTPFRVAFFNSDYDEETDSISIFYLIGGRHRLEALLYLINEKGEEEDSLDYRVTCEPIDTVEQLMKLVETDNGSRSMTGSEGTQIKYCASKSNFEDGFSNLNELKAYGVPHYKVSSNGLCTKETLVKIWKRSLITLNKADKKLVRILTRSTKAQANFANLFSSEITRYLSDKSGNIARSYTTHADNLAQILENECSDYPSLFGKEVKEDNGVPKEIHDWIHSDKLASYAAKSTDIDVLKQNLQDNLPSNGEDKQDGDEFSQF